jgi:uncharacterized membrane protein
MPRHVESRVYFDAVLTPHRSLSLLGFRLLMGITAFTIFTVGTGFWLLGAWPVMGFCGLEFGLLYVAFKLNYRQARVFETVRLTDTGLTVRRVWPHGRERRWEFQPNWLAVRIDEPPEHHSQLTLSSHGRSLVVGAFLTPEERLQVAQALRRALADWRTAPLPATP